MEQQKQTQGEGEADTPVVFGVEDVPPVHLTILFGLQVRIHVLYTYFYVPVWNRRAATGVYGFIILFYSDKGYVINCFAVIIFASTMFSTSNCRNSLFAN